MKFFEAITYIMVIYMIIGIYGYVIHSLISLFNC